MTSVTREREETLSFTLWNGRDAPMTITGHQDVDGPTPDAFSAADAMLPFLVLDPLGYAEIAVTFRPSAQRADYEGMIIVRSLTDDVPPVLVRLFGEGLAPVLSAALEERPEAPLGCSADATLVIGNAGGETLHVEAAGLDDLGPFALLDEIPSTLAPGAQARVPLRFTPALAGSQVGLLSLATDDPAHPETELVLTGTGAAPEVVTESFHYSSGDGVGVLILLEDAADTDWEAKVGAGLDDLVRALDQRGVAWRIAAASTQTACPDPGAPWGEPSHGEAAVRALLSDVLFDGQAGAYGDRLLELARRAIEQAGPGECLDGWLSAAEPLHVVLFADADDASAAGWEAELARMSAAAPGGLLLSAVVPAVACGGAVQGYESAANTTGGAILDLCAGSWATHWEELAARTAAIEEGPTVHTLARKPLPGTVSVRVGGHPWADVSVDEAAGVVSFPTPPSDGAEVQVSYVPRDICP